MKIKDGFSLVPFADGFAVVADEKLQMQNMVISLNKTSAFLWERLQKGCSAEELTNALCESYDVDREIAVKDIERFIGVLKTANVLE